MTEENTHLELMVKSIHGHRLQFLIYKKLSESIQRNRLSNFQIKLMDLMNQFIPYEVCLNLRNKILFL